MYYNGYLELKTMWTLVTVTNLIDRGKCTFRLDRNFYNLISYFNFS